MLELLKTIKADDPDVIYRSVSHKAAEWAVCGYVNEMNELLELLWAYDIKNADKDYRLNDGFQTMWDISGKKPKTEIPFAFRDIKQIEKENLDYFLLPFGSRPVIDDLDMPLSKTVTDYLFVKAVYFYSTEHASVEEILIAIYKFIEESRVATEYAHFQATTFGCILAAKSGNNGFLFDFLKKWADGYLKYPDKYSASFLLRNRVIDKLLLSGILAPQLSVTKLDCENDFKILKQALKERSEKGRTLIYGELTWKELLKRISVLAVKNQQSELPPEVVEKEWLGFEPASLDEIRSKEDELGVQFPQDYVDFLLTTDGFFSCESTCPTLCSIDEVGFLREIEPMILDFYDEYSDGEILVNSFKNGIFIGGLHDEQQMFLGPVENGEWACWFFASWLPGEWQFHSLRYYMEYQLRTLENEKT